jgi:Xaa-Pro dipeptidase
MDPHDRIGVLQSAIVEDRLVGAVLSYSRDLLYYTGTAQPACLVVLPDEYWLYVRSGMEFTLREIWLPGERVVAERRLDVIVQRHFPGEGHGQKVGVEMDTLSAQQAQHLARLLGGREMVDLSGRVLAQRMIKSPREILSIEKACAAVDAGHAAALGTLREGVTELELAAAVENAHRLAGHEGAFFMRQLDFFMSRGPLASGPNLREISGIALTITGRGLSTAVPAGPSRRVICPGDHVLIDIPTCVEGYHADQSRMYCLGEPSAETLSLYGRLKAVADHLIANLRPTLACGEVYGMAQARAAELGLAGSFLRFPSGAQAHFVGHGLGLELNEPPFVCEDSKEPLREGMVLSLELHLMEPEGHVLKLEDMVCMERHGCRLLTRTPRELTAVFPPRPAAHWS